MPGREGQLRIAFVVGTLAQGGAEKQLMYMLRALLEMGVAVQVYSLTRGEYYEAILRSMGLTPIWVGQSSNAVRRMLAIAGALSRFRPHVVQSSHTFSNLYAALASRRVGAISIGALRTNLAHTRAANRGWTQWHIRMPSVMSVNSETALNELVSNHLVRRDRVFMIANAIDLAEFDARSSGARPAGSGVIKAIFVARLIRAKRLDRFLRVLGIAREREKRLQGVVVGEGPERELWHSRLPEFGLSDDDVCFLGRRDDVIELLSDADMLVLSSDEEGFPNVLLEAMAAGLPAITTPAGDAPSIVKHGVTGFVVPFDDHHRMAGYLIQLAQSAELRQQMGAQGRREVEATYSFERLGYRLLETYGAIACALGEDRLLAYLSQHAQLREPMHSPGP